MKKLVYIICLFSLNAFTQVDYFYFANDGDDDASGTSPSTPWLHPNNHGYTGSDILYFKRGDVFDTVNLTDHFNVDDNIMITDYGDPDENPPVLSGAIRITDFVNLTGNIWYKVVDLGTFPRGGEIYVPNGITVNGRWALPAQCDSVMTLDYTGCGLTTVDLKYATFSTNELANAYIAVMTRKWKYSTVPVSSNTSNIITTSTSMVTNPYSAGKDLYAKIWMLDSDMDEDNEWTYDGDTLKIYSMTNPNTAKNVRLTMVDTIIYNNGGDNFRIQDVVIEQSNHIGFLTKNGTGAYCDTVIFNSISGYAFNNVGTDTIEIKNSKFEDIHEHSIKLESSDSILVENNFINRNGYLEGLGNRDYSVGSSGAIRAEALRDYGRAYYQYNYFDSCGLAFQLYSDHNYTTSIVRYNWIENFGLNRVDNGAIYWASQPWSTGVYRNSKNNIILNSISFGEGRFGTSVSTENNPVAVYVDEDAIKVMADSNTIENVHGLPLKYNRRNRGSFNYNRIVRGNTSMGDVVQSVQWMCGQAVGSSTSSADRDTMRYNQFVLPGYENAAVYSRNAISSRVAAGYDDNYFYIDYNKYAFPFGTYNNIARYDINYGAGINTYSLAQIQSSGPNFSANTQDANSSIEMQNDYSGKSISQENYVKVFKNFSTSAHTFDLDGSYEDIDGNAVTTSIEVPAMYSEILFWQSGDTTDVDIYFDTTLIHLISGVPGSAPEPDTDTVFAVDTIEAENYDLKYGNTAAYTGPPDYMGDFLGYNDSLKYEVYFNNEDSISLWVAVASGYDNYVVWAIDSITNPNKDSVYVTNTGGWTTFVEYKAPLTGNYYGFHDVILASRRPNVDKFTFYETDTVLNATDVLFWWIGTSVYSSPITIADYGCTTDSVIRLNRGEYIYFTNVDFSETINSLEIEFRGITGFPYNDIVDVRLGSTDGPLLASYSLTGDGACYIEETTISNITGTQNVYVVWNAPYFYLGYIRFYNKTYYTSSNRKLSGRRFLNNWKIAE